MTARRNAGKTAPFDFLFHSPVKSAVSQTFSKLFEEKPLQLNVSGKKQGLWVWCRQPFSVIIIIS